MKTNFNQSKLSVDRVLPKIDPG